MSLMPAGETWYPIMISFHNVRLLKYVIKCWINSSLICMTPNIFCLTWSHFLVSLLKPLQGFVSHLLFGHARASLQHVTVELIPTTGFGLLYPRIEKASGDSWKDNA